jgi:NTE family protein
VKHFLKIFLLSGPDLDNIGNGANKSLRSAGLRLDGPTRICGSLHANHNADLLSAVHQGHAATAAISAAPDGEPDSLLSQIQRRLSTALSLDNKDHDTPSVVDVVTASINIMQVRITRSRLAGEPADALITPRLAQFALLDFHRGREAIEEGEAATERAMPQIRSILGR